MNESYSTINVIKYLHIDTILECVQCGTHSPAHGRICDYCGSNVSPTYNTINSKDYWYTNGALETYDS
jgi:hypothetical protein